MGVVLGLVRGMDWCWLGRSRRGVVIGVCVGVGSVGVLRVVGLGRGVLRVVLRVDIRHLFVVWGVDCPVPRWYRAHGLYQHGGGVAVDGAIDVQTLTGLTCGGPGRGGGGGLA